MKITLDLKKSIEQNASDYYTNAKKLKKKLDGAKKALQISQKRLEKIDSEIEAHEKQAAEAENKKARKKEWYEKFHWFISTSGKLVIAGRDATTNEIIIKKYTDMDDLVIHSSMAGSPFGVIKADKDEIGLTTKQEAGQFVAAYSRAWRQGLTSMEVFCVKPDQVTKEAPSGEYIQKGSFMIYGKKEIFHARVEISLGKLNDGRIMAGPDDAVKKHCKNNMVLVPGREKSSAMAKSIQKELGGELDDIIRALPAGGCRLKKG